MTQDEIIAMAIEAGIWMPLTGAEKIAAEFAIWRFAAMVAAAEREGCALACEAIETRTWAVYKGSMDFAGESGRADPRVYGMSDGASECATAIRARGANV